MPSPDQGQSNEHNDFDIRFPEQDGSLDQNEEWFEFRLNGQTRRMRIHDYAGLFSVPGLYESLVYEKLACNSPRTLTQFFGDVLDRAETSPGDLRVLDLGAGNGMVAEELKKLGADHIVGLDLLPEARQAAQRDRPDVYADYMVADLCNLTEKEYQQLDAHKLNCLVTVAALGFGDIPAKAFAEAFNSLSWEGWLAMTIKEDFLSTGDQSGFGRLLKSMIQSGVVRVSSHQRYCHRLSITGEPIHYISLVAKKLRDIPTESVATVESRAA